MHWGYNAAITDNDLFPITRERATAHRTIRRNEKKVKELMNNIDDERKQGETHKTDVSLIDWGCGHVLRLITLAPRLWL